MAIPHFDVKIVSRGKGQSVVASSAYQSGEKLYSERDHKTKHYSEKQGIVFTELLIPENAPEEYKDRNTLWNAVEKVEKQWNSQLARRFVIAIPRELPPEQYPELLHEYCMKEFVEKGMCCDIAIHDKDGTNKNPHAHLLLTLRPFDENGNWGDKSHKVYDLDENGEKIILPSGEEKSHKVSTTGWDDQKNMEIWRHDWEVLANEYLERAGSDVRLDLRSYERQGKHKVPTVHMGPAVSNMEKKGIQTDIGNLNRDIKEFNKRYSNLRKRIISLKYWISEISHKIDKLIEDIKTGKEDAGNWSIEKPERINESAESKDVLTAQNESVIKALEKQPIVHVLTAYLNKNTEENRNLPILERQKEYQKNLNTFEQALSYVNRNNIKTVVELDKKVGQLEYAQEKIGKAAKYHDSRLKEISMIETKIRIMKRNQSVIDSYDKKKFNKTRTDFYNKHKLEIDEYYKAKKYLEIHNGGRIDNLSNLSEEKKKLLEEKADIDSRLENIEKNLEAINVVKECVDIALERVTVDSDGDGKEQSSNSLQGKIKKKQAEIEQSETTKKNQERDSNKQKKKETERK